MTARSSRSAHPPGLDWEDSFFTLDERYRQLQKQLNEKEDELKRWKVAARRAAAAPAATSAIPHSHPRSSLRSPSGAASAGRARASLDRQSGSASRPMTSPAANVSAGSSMHRTRASGIGRIPADFAWPPAEGDTSAYAHPAWSHATPGTRHPEPTSASRLDSESTVLREDTSAAADSFYAAAADSFYAAAPSRAQPDAARAAAINEASMWGPESMLPDPSLIWGAEGSVQNYVAASALYHANEEMRRKLTEATTTIQSQQQELSATRTLVTNMQSKMEDVTQQMHHLVRERDLATQKLASAKLTNADLEKALQNHVSEQERICFGLEAQITELRSRLVVGTDSNEQLSRDVRTLLNEAREKSAEAMTLRSKLALVESALTSQKNTNENLLVELKSLSQQLVDERKRTLSLTRDVQLSGLDKERVAALQDQLQRVKNERDDHEREHVRLMSDFVHITEGALQQAREEVRADLQDWREAATHWEEVSQLLYKDIAERTQTHTRCREECEEAKALRDTYNVQLNSAREELALCRAKLDVVWPGHAADTQNLSADDIRNAFGSQNRVPFMQMVARNRRKTKKQRDGAARREKAQQPATSEDVARSTTDRVGDVDTAQRAADEVDGTVALDTSGLIDSSPEEDPLDELWALPLGTDGDAAEQLRELHEANMLLLAELQQLRVSNELLQSRVELVADQYKTEKQSLKAEAQSLGSREAASQRLLERQMDRVAFLEAQVQSLRGHPVESGVTLDSLSHDENVLELFLGQLVSTAAPANLAQADASASAMSASAAANAMLFDRFFCSADFLVHEAVVTPPITGMNGFFDTTASFQIAMDALLLYYLQTRDLTVQLHRMRSDEEVQAELQKEEEAARQTTRAPEQPSETRDDRELRAGSERSATGSHSTTGSSERMAARLYETVAEGRVSLLDLVLDERTRRSARPTYKGHVRLETPQGQHLASLEFQVTARTAFTDDFQQLVVKAFADAADESGNNNGLTTRRTNTAPQRSMPRTALNDKVGSVRHTSNRDAPVGSHLQAWMSNASSTGSSTPRHRRTQKSHYTRPRDRSGLQLLPSSQQSVNLVREWASSASHTSSASSMLNASSSSQWGGGDQGARRRTLLRSTRTAAPAPPPPQRPSMAQSTSSPPSPLQAGTHFVHVPTAHTTSMSAIRSLTVEVERVELPGEVGVVRPPPRLSCLYLLPAVGQDVRLVAPAAPRYTIEYEHGRNAFNVHSLAQLSELTREPLTFFLVAEDTPQSSMAMTGAGSAIYALAVCEWSRAVEHIDAPQQFHLPLLRRETYEVVPGAALVVTLTASTSAASDQPPHFSSPAVATPGPAPTMAPGCSEPAAPPPPPAPAPLLSTTSRREERAAPGVAPQWAPTHPTTPGPFGGEVPPLTTTSNAAPSMEQLMMQMEWQRMQ